MGSIDPNEAAEQARRDFWQEDDEYDPEFEDCTIHHHACDCREAKFEQIAQENAALKVALEEMTKQRDDLREIIARIEDGIVALDRIRTNEHMRLGRH